MLKRKTLDLLYKITVRSVIDYALPIYANTLKKTDLARLERLQYGAAKLVTGALHHTSREKLNNELGWENVKTRIDFLGLSIFHKIHLKETRPLIRSCMTKLDFEKEHVTRSKGGYTPPHTQIMTLNILIHSSHTYQNCGTTSILLLNPWLSQILNLS